MIPARPRPRPTRFPAGVYMPVLVAVAALLGACSPADGPASPGAPTATPAASSAASSAPGAAPPASAAPAAEPSVPIGLEGDAMAVAPPFVGASRGGLHPSALPDDQGAWSGSGTETAAENRQVGTAGWLIGDQPPAVRIEGYADALSVLAGQPVGLHVSSTARAFRVDVLRTGDYEGRLARRVFTTAAVAGGVRTGVVQDPTTRMVSATWPRSVSLDTTGWPPGAYLAKLIGADGAMSFVPFVVRAERSKGAVLLVHSMATWQAYNPWGGVSTYRGYAKKDKATDFELRSTAASFDRPHARENGTGTFLTKELPVVAAAERLGLRLNYAADLDLQLHPEVLDGAVGVVLLGHSEYWSRPMRENLTAARDRGVNLAFLGANAVHRRIRLASSPLGPGRVLINYKLGTADPVTTEDTTADWGKKPHPLPQSSLVGSMFECAHASGDLIVSDPRAWPFAGLGLAVGARLPGVIGPEFDRVNTVVDTPRPMQVLSHSPVACRGQPDAADVTWYSHSTGAGVFTAGTLQWGDAMTSANATVRRVITTATERVLREVARPRAGARLPARDNVALYYTPRGALRGSGPATSPSVREDLVDPNADAGTDDR